MGLMPRHVETILKHKRPNGILGRDGFTVLAHYYGKELVLDATVALKYTFTVIN